MSRTERLAGMVDRLERVHFDAITLLGTIIGTLVLPRNVEALSETETGKKFVEIARDWEKKFMKINEESSSI